MPHANGRIRTTHAGSLPRPDDLADMIWARMDGEAVDEAQLEQRIDSAVREVAARDVPLVDIIGEVLKVDAGTIYVEGANARHAHEWRVFEDVGLPDDTSVILGVIDVKSNCVEHPQVVADRLIRLGQIIGSERLIAGTDCGFDTFIRFSQVDPAAAWLKLRALVEGAELASAAL
jgi:methionine synthase II (cobalamin-independent)